MNKKAKLGSGIFIVLILLVGYLYLNPQLNPFSSYNQNKKICEDSGGSFLKDYQGTYTCVNCPSDTFKQGGSCIKVNPEQTKLCSTISSNGWICSMGNYNLCYCEKIGKETIGFYPSYLGVKYCRCNDCSCGCFNTIQDSYINLQQIC